MNMFDKIVFLGIHLRAAHLRGDTAETLRLKGDLADELERLGAELDPNAEKTL